MIESREAARPPYRQALKAIGRYFDEQPCRGIFVAEVDEGYIGKAYPAHEPAELHAEGFTFPFEDVRSLIQVATGTAPTVDGPPHCPYGYGVFMEAAGEVCDRAGASYVSVLEVTNAFVLCFTVPREDGRDLQRRRYVLDRIGVEELLNGATV